MKELRELLKNIPDTYDGLIYGVLSYCYNNEERRQEITDFIVTNPEVKSSDIVKKMLSNPDYWRDEGAEIITDGYMKDGRLTKSSMSKELKEILPDFACKAG